MSQRRISLLGVSMLALAAFAMPAAAQTVAGPRDSAWRVGGDVTAVIGPPDEEAYFNYTDYEHNALRVARLRLSGEWRALPSLSFLAQAQTENVDSVSAVAAYLRWRPWADRALVIQAGRIPPVIGAFARRAYAPDNAVIGSPLAYQYLASLRPDALPENIDDVLRMRGRGWLSSFPIGSQVPAPGVPLVSAHWDTGVQVGWRQGNLDLSGAVTMGAPAVPRLEATNTARQWSGRGAVHLAPGLTIGVSGARGGWIDRQALGLMPADRREATQTIVGADVELGRGRWLMRGEWLRSSFAVPLASDVIPVAHLTASTIFMDLRYRLHPRWQIGGRLEHLGFATVQSAVDGPMPWDAPVQRFEATLGFRVRRNVDVRGGWQHDWRAGGRIRERGYPALQLITWF